MITKFDVKARATFTDIMAHEYQDEEQTMNAKIAMLALLIRDAQCCVAYTGAGISTAAGIDDYASKAKEESVTASGRPVIKDWKMARPTKAHRVLTALHQGGKLKHWIQQNHDSLPQKAGFPQDCLNEIHGSLHDPSNPIVPYEGTLRPELFEWMNEWSSKADLVLSLGTSMSGFNADNVPRRAAQRYAEGRGLGLVIVNLQQTEYDEQSTLRIFGRLDDVMERLAAHLELHVQPMESTYTPKLPEGCQQADDVFLLPFDESGRPASTPTLVWDLRLGAKVRLTGGPYAGDVGTVVGRCAEGHYCLRFEDSVHPTFGVKRRPFRLWLGSWWVEMAARGMGLTGKGGALPLLNAPAEPPLDGPRAAERVRCCCVGGAGASAEPSSGDGGAAPPVAASRYAAMLRVGLSREAVRQRMGCDGVPAAAIDELLARL